MVNRRPLRARSFTNTRASAARATIFPKNTGQNLRHWFPGRENRFSILRQDVLPRSRMTIVIVSQQLANPRASNAIVDPPQPWKDPPNQTGADLRGPSTSHSSVFFFFTGLGRGLWMPTFLFASWRSSTSLDFTFAGTFTPVLLCSALGFRRWNSLRFCGAAFCRRALAAALRVSGGELSCLSEIYHPAVGFIGAGSDFRAGRLLRLRPLHSRPWLSGKNRK